MYFRYRSGLARSGPMTNLRLVLLALALPACMSDEISDLDEAITEDEVGKADEVQAYKHYLLVAGDPGDVGTGRYLVRAGGGRLRCPDDVVRDRCEITDYDLVMTSGLDEVPGVLIDELETTPMIARGRLVRTDDDRVYLRMSALTRGITTVVPSGVACYRVVPSGSSYVLAKLDAPSIIVKPRTLYFDDVDPTPDFWGQPTPAVQADIDDALAMSASRPVYTCAALDKRDSGMLVWAQQVFAPR